ncbi:uncharacterized protein LOC101887296 isoform X1 [Musca domestica]|uniref:Uncharacterized protein LOC101887296 isoform X1 n=2 Tax=Musca domestica TaxID=7370 RepID=A0A9J7I391_MUSDO|nr:uncharacterized protein LOC101887296 isoform X1 [Musca domestica]
MLGLRIQATSTVGGGTVARMAKTNSYGYLCFCSRRHNLIMFVGMTLLIVSYGVNTEQMSAGPVGLKAVSSANTNLNNNRRGIGESSVGKENTNRLQHAVILLSPVPQDRGRSSDSREQQPPSKYFINFRKSRLFGLLGSNYSLSYNLTIGSGSTAGNITVAAPAPAYYYAAAPYYPYGYDYYYNPYAYNPYAYNPYAYNPYGYNPYYSYY